MSEEAANKAPPTSAGPSVEEMLLTAELRFQAAKDRLINLIRNTSTPATVLVDAAAVALPPAATHASPSSSPTVPKARKSATEYVLKPENWGVLAATMGVTETSLGDALPLLGASARSRGGTRAAAKFGPGAGAVVRVTGAKAGVKAKGNIAADAEWGDNAAGEWEGGGGGGCAAPVQAVPLPQVQHPPAPALDTYPPRRAPLAAAARGNSCI